MGGGCEIVLAQTSSEGADLTRDQADTLFLEAMASLGVDELTRTIIHQAVVRFGARAFRKHLG